MKRMNIIPSADVLEKADEEIRKNVKPEVIAKVVGGISEAFKPKETPEQRGWKFRPKS